MHLTATAVGRPDGASRPGCVARSLPWVVVCVWLAGALVAFWTFEFRLQGTYGNIPWCVAAARDTTESHGRVQ
jgi:hypothetical protein